jgi:hypothetical protein
MREVHAATYPGAKLPPRAERMAVERAGEEAVRALAVAELLTRLDTEIAEDEDSDVWVARAGVVA